MKRVFLLVPSGHEVGLTTATLGLIQGMSNIPDSKQSVGFVKPIAQVYGKEQELDNSIALTRKILGLNVPDPITLNRAEHLLSTGNSQQLMEEVVELFSSVADKHDVIVVEGMATSSRLFYAKRLNALMIRALDADPILVSSPGERTPEQLRESLEIEVRDYLENNQTEISGCIINKLGFTNEAIDNGDAIKHTKIRHFASPANDDEMSELLQSYTSVLDRSHIPIAAVIPWLQNLISPTVKDIADYTKAHGIRKGEWSKRRIESVALCAMGLSKCFYYFQEGALILTTADRADVLIAAAMASLNGVKLAGILLCGRFEPDPNALIMCEKAFSGGLPLFSTNADIYHISSMLARFRKEITLDDEDKARDVMQEIAQYIKPEWLSEQMKQTREHRISPPEFRNLLIKLSRRKPMRIVLPEGEEPRTLRAAVIAAQRKIAIPVLLGDRTKIEETCTSLGIVLPANLEILSPAAIAQDYVEPLVELRKSKGMTHEKALELLQDSVYIGTMMLKTGAVDGLVSGAVHSTADTVRPAMQIIKTAPGSNLVSSVFFMCLPNQVLVYGDCAINQEPTAEELAQIALQSAESAQAFKIPVRIAMISYSTGTSGRGTDVEKVRQATEIVKTLRPDILIDGPLQYDAATTPSVAKTKAPNSPVAGRATILVFPDLNTGNTTYKAVQRSANLISIGPMLQGLDKPVNDLSRGALVDDILYTIALTAIQAQAKAEKEPKANDDTMVPIGK